MGDNSRFYIPVLTFLTLAAVVLLARFLPDVSQWEMCGAGRCTVQDWAAATAGWVGFAAATVGAFWVYGQLREQRLQTAFMIGDASPTFEVYWYSADDRPAVFTVTNWNRRNISIVNAEVIFADSEFPAPTAIRYGNSADQMHETMSRHSDGEFPYAPIIFGWIDRHKPPQRLYISFVFPDGLKAAWEEDIDRRHHWLRLAEVRCVFYFNNHERHPLRTFAQAIDILPDAPRKGKA